MQRFNKAKVTKQLAALKSVADEVGITSIIAGK